MDIVLLLLSKKHSDPLSEEKRQRVICDLICQGVREHLGFFTEKIRYCGEIYRYERCYNHDNSPCSFLEGIAGVVCYRRHNGTIEKVVPKKERRPSLGNLLFGRRSSVTSSSSEGAPDLVGSKKGKLDRRSSVDCRSIASDQRIRSPIIRSPRPMEKEEYEVGEYAMEDTEDKVHLLLVWDVSYLGIAREMCARFEARVPVRIPLRIIVFNWNDALVDFTEYSIEGGNLVSASQCMRSIPFDLSSIPSWTVYQERKISPR